MGPRVAAERFLYAFTRLDQECFNEMWAEDATAFLPLLIGDAGPGRLNGRDEILATFDKFFGGRQASEDDVLEIDPVSLRVDHRGDVAIVSFVLGPNLDNRRSFVFRREADGWRIWHHHASWLGDFEAILEAEVQKQVSEITNRD
nr:nuclear transport factor 2 family protein [Sphingomicrobium sediminis]